MLTVLTNATLLDCTGAEPRANAWVLIQDDRIKEIGEGPTGVLPEGTKVINCHGQTLMPGLIDAHAHMASVDSSNGGQQRNFLTSTLILKSLRVIKETLDQGFTTIRDCGGIDAGYRDAVAEGIIPGPRLFVSGSFLTQTGGHADWRLPTENYAPVQYGAGVASVVCDGVSEVRKATREQLRRGVDFIKIMAGGGATSTAADKLEYSQFSLEELQAFVFEAQAAGTYVCAHCLGDSGIKLCSQAGVGTIEHGNLLTDSSAQAMKNSGAYLGPTLVTYKILRDKGKELGYSKLIIDKLNYAVEMGDNSLKVALANGVKIGSGSDLLGPMQIYKGLELELQAKAMGPMGAIIAATRTNAEIIRQEKDLGTIEVGKLADLIVVKGDPLKTISLFQDYENNITLIMQSGKIYKNFITLHS